MTNEDIIRMAHEAGFDIDATDAGTFICVHGIIVSKKLKDFANLVAAAERDACAKLVDYWEARQGEHSEAIRARGQPEPWVKTYSGGKPNYTEPKEWVGLTDEELEFYTEELGQGELGRGVLRAVVDFLKEKNT
jgi:hypothetical protein